MWGLPWCTPLAVAADAGALGQVQRCRLVSGRALWAVAAVATCAPCCFGSAHLHEQCAGAAGDSGRQEVIAGAAALVLLLARPHMRSGSVQSARAVRAAQAARDEAALPLRQRVVDNALTVGLLAAGPCKRTAHAPESVGS